MRSKYATDGKKKIAIKYLYKIKAFIISIRTFHLVTCVCFLCVYWSLNLSI